MQQKTTLVLLCAVALFAACSSPEKKAQQSVNKYLKDSLNDPGSYESISYGKLDSNFSSYGESANAKSILSAVSMINEEFDAVQEQYKKMNSSHDINLIKYGYEYDDTEAGRYENTTMLNLLKQNKAKLAQEDSLLARYKREEKKFKKEFDGYNITHKFRAKNALGALIIQNWKFKLSKDYNVLHTETITE